MIKSLPNSLKLLLEAAEVYRSLQEEWFGIPWVRHPLLPERLESQQLDLDGFEDGPVVHAPDSPEEVLELRLHLLIMYVDVFGCDAGHENLFELDVYAVRNDLHILLRRHEIWISEHLQEVIRRVPQSSIEVEQHFLPVLAIYVLRYVPAMNWKRELA